MAKILLFADNLEVYAIMAEILVERGHNVVFTASETEEKDFDLLLIDPAILRGVQNVHFEGVAWLVTGLEFLKRLRQAGVTTPALILAAISRQILEESWKGSFDSLGYYRFLSLPATLNRILTEVERLLTSVSLQPEGSAP
jgi:CheY-like chemotaxis protein